MLGHDCNTLAGSKFDFWNSWLVGWLVMDDMGLINKVDMVCLSPVGYGV